VAIIRRELGETKTQMRPRDLFAGLPGWWLAQASCIRSHEGAWTSDTGNGYFGAYQFLLGTWVSVGGHGLPSSASPGEQTFRAHLVWLRDGGSWAEWGTAGKCGLS
jgi:transglycosylase-like protein